MVELIQQLILQFAPVVYLLIYRLSQHELYQRSVLRYKRMREEIFIVRNRITLQAAILEYLEGAVHSHPFSKISPGNTGG